MHAPAIFLSSYAAAEEMSIEEELAYDLRQGEAQGEELEEENV